MKDIEKKHRLVELRAHGKSQRAVADELEIGLQTVVRFERELKEQIENLKVIELNALLEAVPTDITGTNRTLRR